MHITQLKAENVKRLKAVTIKPDGSLIQITGKNRQGKSSVLDAIAYALGGKDVQCDQPVRQGAESAKVVIEIGDLRVKRTWSAQGGTYLAVESLDGTKHASPQKLLDDMVGNLTFDPLAFTRMSPSDQIATLKQVAGLDFVDLDTRRQSLFDERTQVNRDLKTAQAQLKDVSAPDADVPDAEINITDLTAEQQRANEQIQANNRIRQEAATIATRIDNGQQHITTLKDQWGRDRQTHEQRIAKLEQELQDEKAALVDAQTTAQADLLRAENLLVDLQTQHQDKIQELANLKDPDVQAINQRIATADATNKKVRNKKRYNEKADAIKKLRDQSEELTAKIDAIDRDKEQALTSAKMPVPGLGFDESGVVYNGLPFNQASQAEALRVSVAMGIALNPKLRVMLNRDGSLLDKDSLALLAEMAEANDMQVWLERVSDGEPVGIVIEDGMVVNGAEIESEPAQTAAAN